MTCATRAHSSVARAAHCRAAQPWFKSGCAPAARPACMHQAPSLTPPGVELGLSRPRRDALTTKRMSVLCFSQLQGRVCSGCDSQRLAGKRLGHSAGSARVKVSAKSKLKPPKSAPSSAPARDAHSLVPSAPPWAESRAVSSRPRCSSSWLCELSRECGRML